MTNQKTDSSSALDRLPACIERLQQRHRQSQQLLAVGKFHAVHCTPRDHGARAFYFEENFLDLLTEDALFHLGNRHTQLMANRRSSEAMFLNLDTHGRRSTTASGSKVLLEETFANSYKNPSLIMPLGQMIRYGERCWTLRALFGEKVIWVTRLPKAPLSDFTLLRVDMDKIDKLLDADDQVDTW